MAVSYELVDPGNKGFHEDHWAVKITDGDLDGYIFQYDCVKIIEHENPEDGAVLEFNTITLSDIQTDLTEDEKRDILGDILVDILKEQIDNANGTPDPE